MTDIKHAFQRDVFTPNGERLLGVVQVGKAGAKKKKSSYLCASVTIEKPVEVYINKIKKQEKGESYKKQKVWHLRQLKVVNGKETDKGESCEFDLQFDKNFKWSSTTAAEKHTFLSCLSKLCNRYLPRQQKPSFINLPQTLLEVSVSSIESTRGNIAPGPDDDVLENYQALSEQEETDLEKMMTECEFAISDAEAFSNSLSKDLSVLDGQNIHSIMGSEAQVNSLMLLLDKALAEVSRIEASLDEYDLMVGAIASQMSQMKNQESFIQITNKNHSRLLDELDTLVMQLDLSKGHIKALQTADLNTDSGIEACTSAAEALQEAMEVELPIGLSKLHAVSEQQKLFDGLRQQFAVRLYEHLCHFFSKQGNEHPGSSLAKQANDLKLPKHFPYHRDLLPYKGLVLWLKVADKTKYIQIGTEYTKNLSKVYTQEIKEFMATAKQRFMQQAGIDLGAGGMKTGSTMTLDIPSEKKSHGLSFNKSSHLNLDSTTLNL